MIKGMDNLSAFAPHFTPGDGGGSAARTSGTLAAMQCVACEPDEPRLTDEQIEELHAQVTDWKVVSREGIKRLERSFKFKNFREALAFTNQVGELAEQEQHHPALLTEYGRVSVSWWTHAVRGLHRNDFIMAARSDELYEHGKARTG